MKQAGKVKFFKNKERNRAVQHHQPYVPQYQVLGVEPTEYKSAVVPTNVPKAIPSVDNPRLPRTAVRQPYATISNVPIGRGKDVIPNVGNNNEHTWSSVDGEIVDDMSLGSNQDMIDNNDFVTDAALNFPTSDTRFVNQQKLEEIDDTSTNDILEVLETLEVTSYLLLVKGVAICSGPLEEIEEQVQALVFGEHELCDGEPVSEEDIMVFKKMKIRVGVTLD